MKKFSLLFIIFSVFLLTTEGSFFDYFQGRDTFQIDQGCTGTKCIGEGETCIPPGTQPATCLQCSDPFKICEKDAINATELCGCYEDYIECLEKAANFYCDAFATQKSCLSLMTGLENNCTCGTATQRTYTLNSCAFNLRCDNTTSKCAKTLGAGATCGSNTDCGDGNPMSSKLYICNSTTSRCQVLSGWAQVGDSCSTNSDCHGNGERVKCSSGKCVGVTVGGACVDSLDCAFNLYCDPDTMVCANSIAEGSSCNATFADPCQVGTVCGYSGTCIKLFSQAAGASCNTYQECNIGLYCDGTSRLCSAVAAKRSCTIDSDCVGIGGSICECGFDGAKKCQNTAVYYPSECATSLTDLLTCQGENMCKAATIADGSCVTDKCTNQINCYQRCQLEKQQSDKGTGCFGTLPTCASTTSTTGEDNSSNGLLPLSILVTVSLILFAAL